MLQIAVPKHFAVDFNWIISTHTRVFHISTIFAPMEKESAHRLRRNSANIHNSWLGLVFFMHITRPIMKWCLFSFTHNKSNNNSADDAVDENVLTVHPSHPFNVYAPHRTRTRQSWRARLPLCGQRELINLPHFGVLIGDCATIPFCPSKQLKYSEIKSFDR